MRDGIQSLLKSIGECGCLILCMIKIAERYTGKSIDYLVFIQHALANKWLRDDMYVENPTAVMHALTGARWEYEHTMIPLEADNIYCVERWERVTTKETYSHFKLPDWDSLEDSQTVKFGQIVSYRILRRI